ncbi:MAG: Gfo/Idh/MocA family oxidoreductase [Bryobacteraceae bacterium]|nr:Gfo/Idh/MocA family oxidoreductase [Bryobacteraceae bacterium]
MARTKLRWGVLSAAKIGRTKVIPAMQKGERCEVTAIASRELATAKAAAETLGIPKAYGSYEKLLADPDVDAIYNPLPNHLHVPWSILAARAGKHVLCEKPIGLSSAECRALMDVRDETKVVIGEAFMVRTHPQWLRTRDLVRSGELGELRSIVSAFSYFNRDPQNIRNMPGIGGGALMDIGCYPIQISRFLFETEPVRCVAAVDRDPDFGTDRLTSGLLEFASGHSVFSCSTQLAPYQTVQILCTKGRIEIEIPFNAPPDRPCRIFIDDGRDVFGTGRRMESIDTCDQYTIQGDAFSAAVLDGTEVPTPLEDSLGNMLVIEALFASAKQAGNR